MSLPPLEPDTAALLDLMHERQVRGWSELGVEGSRRRMDATPRGPGPRMRSVVDDRLAGPHGPLPVRLYRPESAEPTGLIVYFHGGGMVFGGLDTFDGFARRLAHGSGALVVSVDYRLAPEHPYPVATEEARFAVDWAGGAVTALGVPSGQVAVAGDSAGGSLAAGAALAVRDSGGRPLAFQLLLYPGLERYNPARPSMVEFADGPMLTAADIHWFKKLYLGPDPVADTVYGVPARATDLRGLAPAIVVTAEIDPLRDSGEDYGQRLRAARVPVALLRYPGVCHGFMGAADVIGPGRTAFREVGALARAKFVGETG